MSAAAFARGAQRMFVYLHLLACVTYTHVRPFLYRLCYNT